MEEFLLRRGDHHFGIYAETLTETRQAETYLHSDFNSWVRGTNYLTTALGKKNPLIAAECHAIHVQIR